MASTPALGLEIPTTSADEGGSARSTLAKTLSDQPGRVLAVLVFAPLILYKGYKYHDRFLIIFAILLFIWDLYWLTSKPPRTM